MKEYRAEVPDPERWRWTSSGVVDFILVGLFHKIPSTSQEGGVFRRFRDGEDQSVFSENVVMASGELPTS